MQIIEILRTKSELLRTMRQWKVRVDITPELVADRLEAADREVSQLVRALHRVAKEGMKIAEENERLSNDKRNEH